MDCRRKERREKHVVGRVGLNGLFSQEKKKSRKTEQHRRKHCSEESTRVIRP